MIKKPKDMRIGRRVTVVRSKLHLGQGAFGRRLGVTRSAVSAWERGCGISARMLDKICLIFDISPDWLWRGMGGMWRAIAVQNEPWRTPATVWRVSPVLYRWPAPLPMLAWRPDPRQRWRVWKFRILADHCTRVRIIIKDGSGK